MLGAYAVLSGGYITPPFGFNLFYLRGKAPPGIAMKGIYRSVLPFMAVQIVGMIILMVFSQIVTFLPNLWFR